MTQLYINNITSVIFESLDRGVPNVCTHISPVRFKSYVIRGEYIAISRAQIQTLGLLMEKPNKILLDLQIDLKALELSSRGCQKGFSAIIS